MLGRLEDALPYVELAWLVAAFAKDAVRGLESAVSAGTRFGSRQVTGDVGRGVGEGACPRVLLSSFVGTRVS
jgi:hypothetical protein